MFIGYVFSDEANGIGVILNKKKRKMKLNRMGFEPARQGDQWIIKHNRNH